MTGLRSLSVCYIAAASAFGFYAVAADNPDFLSAFGQQITDTVNGFAGSEADGFAAALNHAGEGLFSMRGGRSAPAKAELDLSPPQPWDGREHATTKLPPIVRPAIAARPLPPDDTQTALAAPRLPDAISPVTPAPPPAPAPPSVQKNMTAREEMAARLRETLTPELLGHFSLFLYVSKADHGPAAQRMYVFGKSKAGELAPLYDWAVSTGREKTELSALGKKTFTATPAGYYELDPARMYRRYRSHAWNGSMPYAMFFDWESRGRQTGVAIHAATGGDIQLLGQRASAGCIHLSPANAKLLYNLIRDKYRGPAPRLAYDRATGGTSTTGVLAHDASGHVKTAEGYQVLVYIENYGGEDVVAALF